MVLTEHKTLATLNLDMNRLCAETADALLPGVSDGQDPTKPNKRLARVMSMDTLGRSPPFLVHPTSLATVPFHFLSLIFGGCSLFFFTLSLSLAPPLGLFAAAVARW